MLIAMRFWHVLGTNQPDSLPALVSAADVKRNEFEFLNIFGSNNRIQVVVVLVVLFALLRGAVEREETTHRISVVLAVLGIDNANSRTHRNLQTDDDCVDLSDASMKRKRNTNAVKNLTFSGYDDNER
jgi:hypothetical protein